MNRIALIDGNSLINRAYYAMRNPMITREGIYTHAIFGFLNMLDKIRKDYEPEYIAVAFDLKAPTFRHEQYEGYKAGRKKMPPELAMEIPLLKDILDAMHITRLEVEGFEADDIIGTMARMGEAAGMEPLIFTGDKDQLQLATDIVKIIYTKRGVSDFDFYDHNAFVEAYGFTPLQFIDYKGLAGDSSDNIPGIPGVGAKTATKLIQQFGSVENIIEKVDEVKPAGLQAKVRDNAMQAMMSKKLATIVTGVPLDIEVEDCLVKEPDYDRLIDIYTKLEFNKFLRKLKVSGDNMEEQMSFETGQAVEVRKDDIKINEITIESRLESIELKGEIILHVFGDNNHKAEPEITSVCIINNGEYYCFDTEKLTGFYPWFEKQIESNKILFAGHNLKESYYMLMCKGIKSAFSTSFDTAIAQYVLDSARSNYDLATLSNEYLHDSISKSENQTEAESGLEICRAVLNMMGIQKEKIKAESLEKIFYEVEIPLIEVMASLEKEGFRADAEFIKEFGDTLSHKIDALASSIHEMAGEDFNINSPVQLGTVLFEKLELPHGKKTKRGYSTNAEVLDKIKGKHPIVPAILEYRTLTKLKSTYVDGLLPLINEDGKIHAHFQQTVTTTGRISCTEPNLQNIPIRQELGRKLRMAFVPENPECILTGADYSQIELRVLAHMAEDDVLIDAFNKGEDIHRATAANVLGVPEDEITPLERSRAKAVNFGVIYGMSAFGLSDELKISRKEANDYIEAYFEKHVKVKEFMDRSVAFARENGYVTTLMGRKRYIKEIHASNYMVRQLGERLAMNTPIQGSAADIIKIAMIKVYNAIRNEKLKSKLILQIHDELIINTYPDEKEKVMALLEDNMEAAYELAVKLKADCTDGSNWYDLK